MGLKRTAVGLTVNVLFLVACKAELSSIVQTQKTTINQKPVAFSRVVTTNEDTYPKRTGVGFLCDIS